MNITQITVSYGETQSLPEYSNVKPNLTITATLDAGEDVAIVEAQLWEHAKDAVHAQIDAALEANNIPAKYSTEPRFQVLKTRTSSYYDRGAPVPPKVVAIVPDGLKLDDRFVGAGYHGSRKLRYGHALRMASENVDEGYTLVDCADGDISRLLAQLPEDPAEPERPFDSEDARAQETTSDEYKAAMGITEDKEEYHEIDDEDDDEDEGDDE
jgi:hypothetical protein